MRPFVYLVLSIFTATHGHSASSFDTEKRQEIINYSAEIRDKFVNAVSNKLENPPSQRAEFYLRLLKSAGPLDQELSKALADLLTIKYFSKEVALNEGIALKNTADQPLDFDRFAFAQRLKQNFEIPILSNLDKHFSEKTWKGHVVRSYSEPANESDEAPSTVIKKGICEIVGTEIINCDAEEPGQICALGNNEKITYTFQKPADIEQMKSIVISVYGGKNITDSEPVSLLYLPDATIGCISLNLPDSISHIHQSQQLAPENIKNTHARYLRIVSNFITHIKGAYPGKQIFLQGSSFGGFFVSSYALLQSVGLNPNIYNDFVIQAFSEKFHDKSIEPVDGIISFSGASDDINQITKQPGWSQYLTVPAFYHWNFDDDRVTFNEALQSILPLEGQEYNRHITLSINRRGAKDYLREKGKKAIEINNIYKVAAGIKASTPRGHFSEDNVDCDLQVIQFVHHAKEMVDSPIHQARQKRNFDIYRSMIRENKVIGHFDATPLDVQQFLSNLRYAQEILTQHSRTTLEREVPLSVPEYEIKLLHMQHIQLRSFRLWSFCNSLGGEDFNLFNDFFKETIQQILPSTDIEENIITHVNEVSLCNFENIDRYLKKFNKEQAFIDALKQYPGFSEFYDREISKYHDQLMNHVTTKGLWRSLWKGGMKNQLGPIIQDSRQKRVREFITAEKERRSALVVPNSEILLPTAQQEN